MSDYRNQITQVLNFIKSHNPEYDSLKDLLDLCVWQLKDNPDNREYCFKYSKYIKDCSSQLHMITRDDKFGELYENGLLFESPYLVDSFFQYIELDETDPYKRFYFPRKKVLQPVVSAYQEVYDGKLDFLSVSQPKRTGKCVEENTLVCTPFGFRAIKDINVGDFIISANGNPTRVIGVYPQETELDVYEIEFTESGKSKQKTVIECCENHLWEVSTEDSRYKNRPNRVINTLEIFNGTIKRGKDKHNNYAVSYIKPVKFEKREISINPWLLGVLLGDGSLCGENIKFSNTESDIIKRVEKIAIKDHNTRLCKVGNGKDYRLSYGNLREELFF